MAEFRPYSSLSARLETFARELAPPGSVIEGVAVRFPAQVRVARVEIPTAPRGQLPPLMLRDLTGSTALGSWLRRQPEIRLSTRVWGGTLSAQGAPSRPVSPSATTLPPLRVTVEARQVRLDELVAWLGVPDVWRGQVRMHLTGTVDPTYPRASVLSLQVSGRELHIPQLDFGDVVLPPNTRATVQGTALYRDERLEMQTLHVSGTGYDLEATLRIVVQDPLDQSPVRGRVSLQLKEKALIRRADVSEETANAMMQVLIATGGRVHARIAGTVRRPEAEVDESETLRSLLSTGQRAGG